MTTSQDLTGNWWGMKVFHTNWAVRSGALLNTCMRRLDFLWKTHITARTVEEVLFPSSPTNTALIAMKLPLISIVVQSTNGAEVKTKLDRTEIVFQLSQYRMRRRVIVGGALFEFSFLLFTRELYRILVSIFVFMAPKISFMICNWGDATDKEEEESKNKKRSRARYVYALSTSAVLKCS